MDPTCSVSDSVGPGWGLRLSIANKLLGDAAAAAAGPWTTP